MWNDKAPVTITQVHRKSISEVGKGDCNSTPEHFLWENVHLMTQAQDHRKIIKEFPWNSLSFWLSLRATHQDDVTDYNLTGSLVSRFWEKSYSGP